MKVTEMLSATDDVLISDLPGLGDGRAVVLSGLARGMQPPERVPVSVWAERQRHVSAEAGTPHPGKWRNDRVPHLVEPMDKMSWHDPTRRVVLKGPAQSGKSEVGVNFFGATVCGSPCTILIVLPSLDEAKKYNKVKLQPTVDETKALSSTVRDDAARDTRGSTALMKRFPGGWAIVTGANSAKGLQMISARALVREEVSGYPDDVDGRGDPAAMAEDRLTAFRARGFKILDVSTPNLAGSCRITEWEAEGDRRRRYLPCPHCGIFQQLTWEGFRFRDAEGRRVAAHFVCPACGGIIEHQHKRKMNACGRWIPTFDDPAAPENPLPPSLIDPADIERWAGRPTNGRHPSYHWWAVINAFETWEDIAADYVAAEGKPRELKVFHQQKLAEAWEEQVDVPDAQRLAERVVDFPLQRIPAAAPLLIGFADVQGNRIEWSVYAFGPGMTAWEIDFGVIPGDPSQPAAWDALWRVSQSRYPNVAGRDFPIDAFGVDSGYLSNQVYVFARRSPRLYATDGRGSPLAPPLGLPRRVDVSYKGRTVKDGVEIWPIGTHAMKVEVYGALNVTLEGPGEDARPLPGSMVFSRRRGVEFFEQLTAEALVVDEKTGKRSWKKRKAGIANEGLDIAVGARALAWHFVVQELGDDEQWSRLISQRAAPPDAPNLFTAASIQSNSPPPNSNEPSANAVRPTDDSAPVASAPHDAVKTIVARLA
jgi:phage terminase large subunit GpA-like protein